MPHWSLSSSLYLDPAYKAKKESPNVLLWESDSFGCCGLCCVWTLVTIWRLCSAQPHCLHCNLESWACCFVLQTVDQWDHHWQKCLSKVKMRKKSHSLKGRAEAHLIKGLDQQNMSPNASTHGLRFLCIFFWGRIMKIILTKGYGLWGFWG